MDFLILVLLVGLAGRSLCAGSEERPTIFDLSIGSKLVENKRFFINCLAPGGDQEINFEWFLNGQKIIPNDNVYVSQIEDSSILNIKSMSLELSGEYECRVSSRFGKDSRSISVKLEGEIFIQTKEFRISSFPNDLTWSSFSEAQVSGRTDGPPDEAERPVFYPMPNHWTARTDDPMGTTVA